jgi:hypothetical protein
MFEIDCPFCQEPCRVDPADFTAATFALRCDGCSTVVEVADAAPGAGLALAA